MPASPLALARPVWNDCPGRTLEMTQDHIRTPDPDRRDNFERRNEQRADRRAHDRYTPNGTPHNRGDRRQGERRRHSH